MKEHSKRMAVCGISAALGVVVMLLGTIGGLGMYMSPMLVGLGLIPIGNEYGKKYQLLLWISISLLSMMMVPSLEQNLMFLCLLGWYPALRPTLQKLPRFLRLPVKILLFNVIVIPLEYLLMTILVPDPTATPFVLLLLLMGNVIFVLYDAAVPSFERIIQRYADKLFSSH